MWNGSKLALALLIMDRSISWCGPTEARPARLCPSVYVIASLRCTLHARLSAAHTLGRADNRLPLQHDGRIVCSRDNDVGFSVLYMCVSFYSCFYSSYIAVFSRYCASLQIGTSAERCVSATCRIGLSDAQQWRPTSVCLFNCSFFFFPSGRLGGESCFVFLDLLSSVYVPIHVCRLKH